MGSVDSGTISDCVWDSVVSRGLNGVGLPRIRFLRGLNGVGFPGVRILMVCGTVWRLNGVGGVDSGTISDGMLNCVESRELNGVEWGWGD